MGRLDGTQTLVNLMKAFAGESQARNRYTFFASTANKEGFRQIEAIFTETADNEREHAKLFYRAIVSGVDSLPATVGITATFPVELRTTYENLVSAAAGEHEEWSDLYLHWGQTAEAEGFPDIASIFQEVSEVEERHEARYLKLAQNVKDGQVFHRDEPVAWKCRNCGYVHEGPDAPAVCPCCKHPRAHFELFVENY
ncbi:MAG: rubrerythrin family protein [Clostridia bacterium]|nr:rubrerythrin family protein [Clostridia bacterium]